MTETDELLEMKEKLDAHQTKFSKLEGRKESLLENFEEKLKTKDSKKISTKLDEINNEIEKDEELLKEGIEKLKTDYVW